MAIKKLNIPQWLIRNAMLLAIVLVTITACKKPERPAQLTFPVTGEIVPNGVVVPANTRIEFTPTQKEIEYRAIGFIDADGKFLLRIPYVDRVLEGATEGPHTVRILSKVLNIGENAAVTGLVPIAGEFVVKPTDKPGENHFKITVPKKL